MGDYLVWLRAALRSGHETTAAGSTLSTVGGRRVAPAIVWENAVSGMPSCSDGDSPIIVERLFTVLGTELGRWSEEAVRIYPLGLSARSLAAI